jgi:hypothetical protein
VYDPFDKYAHPGRHIDRYSYFYGYALGYCGCAKLYAWQKAQPRDHAYRFPHRHPDANAGAHPNSDPHTGSSLDPDDSSNANRDAHTNTHAHPDGCPRPDECPPLDWHAGIIHPFAAPSIAQRSQHRGNGRLLPGGWL